MYIVVRVFDKLISLLQIGPDQHDNEPIFKNLRQAPDIRHSVCFETWF